MTAESIRFSAIKITQPIGELFVARIPSDKLSELAKSDIRRITSRDVEKMTGIQRGLVVIQTACWEGGQHAWLNTFPLFSPGV